MILTLNETSNWASPVSLTVVLLTWYLKIGIPTILRFPVKLGGLLVSSWFFLLPSPDLCLTCSLLLLNERFGPRGKSGMARAPRAHVTCCRREVTHRGRVGSPVTRLRWDKSLLTPQGTALALTIPWTVYEGQGTKPLPLFWDCITSLLFHFGSSSLCEEERKMLDATVMEAGGWGPTSGGFCTGRGRQVMARKHVPCPVPTSRIFQSPLHSFSNSTFRRQVQSPSCKSFKYQFVSDERFCVYSPCGFP